MKKIIFIASYPKSGNTWIRILISSLINKNKGLFNFDDLKNGELTKDALFWDGENWIPVTLLQKEEFLHRDLEVLFYLFYE